MRIALVTPKYHPRTCGVGDNTMRVGQELLRRGIAVRVFSDAPALPHPAAPELEVVAVPGRPPEVCWGLGREFAAFRPDVVLIQHVPRMFGTRRYGFVTSAAVAVQALRARARLHIMAHELHAPWSRRPDWATWAALDRAQLVILRQLADSFFVSTEHRLAQMQSWPIQRHRLGLVPIGSNVAPRPRTPSPHGERFDIGVFSTLSYPNQARLTLEAFSDIAREIPSARLLIIGDTAAHKGSPLAELLPVHPHRARIEVTGKLDLEQVAQRVAALDAYFFPSDVGASTRSSTLPLALATGIPVVAARGEETGSWFRHEENVVLAPRWEPRQMAAATVRLWRDRALHARVARGGTRLFARHLAWPSIVDKLFFEQRGAERGYQVEPSTGGSGGSDAMDETPRRPHRASADVVATEP